MQHLFNQSWFFHTLHYVWFFLTLSSWNAWFMLNITFVIILFLTFNSSINQQIIKILFSFSFSFSILISTFFNPRLDSTRLDSTQTPKKYHKRSFRIGSLGLHNYFKFYFHSLAVYISFTYFGRLALRIIYDDFFIFLSFYTWTYLHFIYIHFARITITFHFH
jgi:hypothetical protein